MLAPVNIFEFEADAIERLRGFFLDAEIQKRITQQAPHQEFE